MRLASVLPAVVLLATLTGSRPVGAQPCPTPSAADASASVLALNAQYIAAARHADADWYRAHMSDDVLVIFGSGRRVDKREFLRLVVEEPRLYRSLTVRDVSVRVFGGTAQVDADAPWELLDGSAGISRYIDTYAWIDCRWQVISAQINLLPAAQ